MSREKQIEEMAKQLYGNFGLSMPTARNVATYLTEKKGYRKASELVEEIFAELETKAPWFCENQTAYEHFNEELAELKKKYTESEKDNGKSQHIISKSSRKV